MVVTTIYIVRHGVSFPSPYHQPFPPLYVLVMYLYCTTCPSISLVLRPTPRGLWITHPTSFQIYIFPPLTPPTPPSSSPYYPIELKNISSLPQFRARYNLSTSTGTYSSLVLSPTGIPSDPPLTSHGEEQSLQLANALAKINDPPIWQVYSSPFYRCLQTVEPFVKKVAGMEVRGDNGLG